MPEADVFAFNCEAIKPDEVVSFQLVYYTNDTVDHVFYDTNGNEPSIQKLN